MKVSIITTSYNSAKTIRYTIISVLNQTYKDIEYIIIDGASSDGTLEIIKEMTSAFHGRISYISEPDKGIYDAMNKGVRMATGDMVGILNSDDFFSSNNVIKRMVDAISDDVDAIYGDVHFVNDRRLDKCIRYYSGSIFRPWMVKFGFIAPHPSFYIRKNVYNKYGLYDTQYKISADFELIARICYIHKINIKYIHQDFVTMRIGGASTKNIESRLIGLKETINACKELGIKTNRFNILLKYLIKTISFLLIRK
jgi:glycosyltransferase involved in cell wall biosynthesis